MSPVNMDPKGISDSRRDEKLSHFSRPYSQEMRTKHKQIATSRHQYTQHGLHRGLRSSSYSQFSSALPSAKHMTSRYEPDILKYVTKPLPLQNAQSIGIQVQLLKPRFIIRRNFGTGTITLSTAPGSANPSPARGEKDFNFFNSRNQFSAPSLARVKSSDLNQTTSVDWRGGFVPSKVLRAEQEIKKHDSLGRVDFKIYAKHKKSRSQSSSRPKPLPPVRNRNSGLPFIERTAQSLLQKSFIPPPIIKAEVTRKTAHFTIESAPTEQNHGSQFETSQNFSKIEEEPQFKIINPINMDDREGLQITENSSSFSCSIPLQEKEEHSPFVIEEEKLNTQKPDLSPITKKSSRRITATNEPPHPVTTLKVKRVVGEKAVNANPLDSFVVGRKCLQERGEL